MAFFGRKKEEDYEDEDGLIEEERADRKLTRKFKDLKPENKKKRNEPPKPWGKKERLLVLITLLVTLLLSGILLFMSNANISLSLSRPNFHFSRPNFSSLNIFKEETIIIQKR